MSDVESEMRSVRAEIEGAPAAMRRLLMASAAAGLRQAVQEQHEALRPMIDLLAEIDRELATGVRS